MKFFILTISVCMALFYNCNAAPRGGLPKCASCKKEDIAACPLIEETEDCEPVPEPSCGCCMMCARKRGENCGVATGFCKKGLYCMPRSFEDLYDIYMDTYYGQLLCMTLEDLSEIIPEVLDFVNQTTTEEPEEPDRVPMEAEAPVVPSIRPVIQPNKIPSPPHSRARTPCFDHLEDILSRDYTEKHEWVPECDRRTGLYQPVQCELSYGLERGRCWCVDSRGAAVSGFIKSGSLSECNRTLNI
ncbi:unnamed protein product [Clavelina lepadiformis]|uniref:IGFBP N-terminal domain-containing protein n=1 Tax=Clavelina lepadiformis TaxID=159417 RepID=A0ABP0F8Q9_CLALP